MTNWQPNCDAAVAQRRAALKVRARAWFASQSVLEVDPPALCDSTVTDPHIASMQTTSGTYLHTSAEFAMKRMLAAGYPDIFSICRVYRDDEAGRLHLPEFTMIEWYRRNFGLEDIIADTAALIASVTDRPTIAASLRVMEYGDALQTFAGVDPFEASIDQLAHTARADESLRESLGERRDAWLDLIMATVVAPQFNADALTVIRHYPVSQAALARRCPSNPDVADRFEIFFGSIELANGYVELLDADEQASRMRSDLEQRRQLGLPEPQPDEYLLAALAAGLPPCAGVALGFERLHMLADGCDDIRDVVTFS